MSVYGRCMTEQQSDWEGDQKTLNRKKAGVIKRVRAEGGEWLAVPKNQQNRSWESNKEKALEK